MARARLELATKSISTPLFLLSCWTYPSFSRIQDASTGSAISPCKKIIRQFPSWSPLLLPSVYVLKSVRASYLKHRHLGMTIIPFRVLRLDFRQMISYLFQWTKTSPCLQLGGVRLTCADSNITAYVSETPISSFRDCPYHLCNGYPLIAARTCQWTRRSVPDFLIYLQRCDKDNTFITHCQ